MKVIFESMHAPGDDVVLTAAIRDLHRCHPNKFITDVHTKHLQIWENNPHITRLKPSEADHIFPAEYPMVEDCQHYPSHMLDGFRLHVQDCLRITYRIRQCRGDIHLTDTERRTPSPYSVPYWLLVAGGKWDFTTKWWPSSSYQAVVDELEGRVCFVRVGAKGDWHPPLQNVIDLVGKTDLRQLIQLTYHAEGVVCPVTLAMHLAAAVPTPDQRLRPCVVIAGAARPAHWEAYPGHRFLENVGTLDCCRKGACKKIRCQKMNDGERIDRQFLCEQPIITDDELTGEMVTVPRCMIKIKPADVVRAVDGYLGHV